MLEKKGFAVKFLLFALVYLFLASLLFWIVKDDWRTTAVATEPVNRDSVLPELIEGTEVSQDFVVSADRIQMLTIDANVQPGIRKNRKIILELSSGKQVFYTTEIEYGSISPEGNIKVPVSEVRFPEKGSKVTLTIRGEGGISFWYGYSRSAGKYSVNVETSGLRLNGKTIDGELVLVQKGERDLTYMNYFWPVAAVLFLIISAGIVYCHICTVRGKDNFVHRGISLIKQYTYLLKTLVIRDFKIKYQASVLGVLWSFLNPLLMTFVYMFVFSTLFRSSIENFVVYLMSGIILFNYFSESTNLGMQSIVGNAGLITKVYMPKYILPISKVLSSGINLVISLIPLLVMMAMTGVRFSKSLLLIPLVMIFLILFCVGVSLVLSAVMVYFRDIQFLWGIMLTILNFLTPVFYPESIIPARFITIYHMNPMYQYLFFMRTIILGGISPTPVTYLYCSLASAVSLAVGVIVFHRCQGKFVLHL